MKRKLLNIYCIAIILFSSFLGAASATFHDDEGGGGGAAAAVEQPAAVECRLGEAEGLDPSLVSFILATVNPDLAHINEMREGEKDAAIHFALNYLKSRSMITGDSNITPHKVFPQRNDGKIDLSPMIAKTLDYLTKEEWLVGMANAAPGKVRRNFGIWNTQIFKSVLGTIEAFIGETKEGRPGAAELDGTLVAINLTKLRASNPELRRMPLVALKELLFPRDLNPDIKRKDGTLVPAIRVSTSTESLHCYPTVVPSLVFEGAPESGHIGHVFLDHAVINVRRGGLEISVLNLGSVVGAKYKNWDYFTKERVLTLINLDKLLFRIYKNELADAATYSCDFFEAMREAIPADLDYSLFDGAPLKKAEIFKVKFTPDTEVREQAELFIKNVLKKFTAETDEQFYSSSDLVASQNKKLEKMKDGKAFLKVLGDILTSLKLGGPTGGFDISHVPEHLMPNLTPDAIYTRVATYAKRFNRSLLLSEALMDGLATTEYGGFNKKVPLGWNSFAGDHFNHGPDGSCDLGVLTPRECSSFKAFGRTLLDQAQYVTLFDNQSSHAVFIMNIHASGDGPSGLKDMIIEEIYTSLIGKFRRRTVAAAAYY